MAMDAVPGKTQEKWKPFCTCSQTAALELGSLSAVAVTGAGLALPAKSPGLGLRKQYKASSPCSCLFLSQLPLSKSWRNSPFCSIQLTINLPKHTLSLPLPLGSLRDGKGQKKTHKTKALWDHLTPLDTKQRLAKSGLQLVRVASPRLCSYTLVGPQRSHRRPTHRQTVPRNLG